MRQWLFNLIFSLVLSMTQMAFILATTLKTTALGGDEAVSGQIGTVFGLTFTGLTLAGGALSDRVGRRGIIFGSLLLAAVACFLMVPAGRISMVILLVGVFAASNAGVWPAFEAWLADRARGPLSREMAAFNLGWAAGAGLGFLVTGLLNRLDAAITYLGAGAVSLLLAACSLAMRDRKPAADEVDRPAEAIDAPPSATVHPPPVTRHPSPNTHEAIRSRARLLSVWLANLAMWFSWGIVLWVFPVQAKSLGFGDATVGVLMAVLSWAEVATFLVLLLRADWHLSARLRVGLQLVAMVGFVLFAIGKTALVLGMALAAFGVGLASTYAASLIVSATDAHARGARTGMHETLGGIGTIFGPLAGGYLAVQLGHWATYSLSILVLAAALVGQAAIAAAARRQLAVITAPLGSPGRRA